MELFIEDIVTKYWFAEEALDCIKGWECADLKDVDYDIEKGCVYWKADFTKTVDSSKWTCEFTHSRLNGVMEKRYKLEQK